MPLYTHEIETHPKLAIGLLRRAGLFDTKRKALSPIPVGHGFSIQLDKEKLKLWIHRDVGQGLRVRGVDIIIKPVKLGHRRYFVCPYTGRHVSEIHFLRGCWGSRAAFPGLLNRTASRYERREARLSVWVDRLRGLNGFPKAKGRNRERIIEKLKSVPFARLRFPELEDVSDAPGDRSPAKRNRLLPPALDQISLVLRLLQSFSGDKLESLIAATISGVPSVDPLPSSVSLALLDTYPMLDIRTLAKWGALGGIGTWAVLSWVRAGKELARAEVIADLRDRTQAQLILRPLLEGEAKLDEQRIALRPAPHSPRLYLVCPRSEKLHDVLYLREGTFASARASRLTHRSQRGPGYSGS